MISIMLPALLFAQLMPPPTAPLPLEKPPEGPSSAYTYPDPEFRKALRPLPSFAPEPEAERLGPGDVAIGPLLAGLEDAGSVGVLAKPPGLARTVRAGGALDLGDAFQTGPKASARLAFEGGSQVLVAPGSIVTVDEEGKAPLVTLKQGEIRVLVESSGKETLDAAEPGAAPRPVRFAVRAPEALMVARGTDFTVRAQKGRTVLHVVSGVVDIAADEARIRRGQGVPVSRGFTVEAVEGRKVSPAEPIEVTAHLRELHERAPKLELLWHAARRDVGSAQLQARFQELRERRAARLNLLNGLLPLPQASPRK